MTKLNGRQSDILSALVALHTQTGQPVSSDDLRKRYRFQFSPATIRHELLKLDEAGLLEQPHTSSGRVPTDQGYRWYVDLLESRRLGRSASREKSPVLFENLDSLKDPDQFFRQAASALSEMVDVLTVGGSLSNPSEPLFKSGFGNIFGFPELMSVGHRQNFGELLDDIDHVVRLVLENVESPEPHVFIGDENPIRQVREYSMLIQKIDRNGTIGVIAMIGPKRMQYEKGLDLLRALEDVSEKSV